MPQIGSTLVGACLPSPAMMLFNRTIRALLLQIGRQQTNTNNDYEFYEALQSRQEAYIKNNDTCNDGSIVGVQMEDGGPWTHSMISEGNSEDDHG